jgi:deazaflavin-dependent oxidoreductase (nitroreductase family)
MVRLLYKMGAAHPDRQGERRTAVDREERLAFNQQNIAQFRASGGRIASFGDAPVLLLTSTGAKSGLPRTNPMMYLADEDDPDRVYVFASAAGSDTNPAWFNNLMAKPNGVTVEIGRETLTADAEVLSEPTREQIYAVQAGRYTGFADYQAQTSRSIPVVALTLHRESR